MNDALLLEVARANYGYHVDEHLRELVQIRDTGDVPVPIPWEPVEVLRLTSYARPDDTQYNQLLGIDRMGSHTMRAFACACLLTEATNPLGRDHSDSVEYYLIGLIESAMVLGPDVEYGLIRFLAWGIDHLDTYEDRAPFAYALLVGAACRDRNEYPEELLGKLVDWVLWESARHHRLFNHADWPEFAAWALGQSLSWYSSKLWCSLSHRMLDCASSVGLPDVKVKLEYLAAQVLAAM